MTTKLLQLQQRKAALEKAIALERSKAKSAQRKIDDRRKILLGAFVLEQLQKSGTDVTRFEFHEKPFMDWLTRDADKEVFTSGSQQKIDEPAQA